MPTDQPPTEIPPEVEEPLTAPVKKPRKPRGKNKPKVKPVPDKPVEIPVQDVNEAPKSPVLRPAGLSFPELEKQVLAARNQPKPEPFVPQITERQAEKTRLEMEAGAKRTAYFEEQERLRVLPPPDPHAPINTPVHRPGDFTPKMGSKDPAIASQTLK
jgi:hypothetical protein